MSDIERVAQVLRDAEAARTPWDPSPTSWRAA